MPKGTLWLSMTWRESSRMSETHEIFESTLESVDKAEELAIQEGLQLGIDEDQLQQFGDFFIVTRHSDQIGSNLTNGRNRNFLPANYAN